MGGLLLRSQGKQYYTVNTRVAEGVALIIIKRRRRYIFGAVALDAS